jgi:diketogulonate reductase-like aldo/keto reductase
MEEILKSGRAKAIGVSNYGVHHLKELFANCKISPSVNQVGVMLSSSILYVCVEK